MDFPLFHLDFMGNRMLIAIIAITHVLINHTLAVGFIPLVTLLEYFGYKKKKTDPLYAAKWDEMTRKIMFVGFIITTTAGAMTGVGIWFAASLVNPASIGSLIRVFYMAWFTEWVVFVLEVVFIMIYYLTWKKSNESDSNKLKHVRFGLALAIFSWLTMAIIVAILGFMMDTGSWLADKTLFSGFVNPIYLPQLYFRTPLAMTLGGSVALFLAMMFVKKDNIIREKAISYISMWVLVWTPVTAAGAIAYYFVIPDLMIGNLPTAVGTMAFSGWYDTLLWYIGIAVVISFLFALWGFLLPKKLPKFAMIVPVFALLIFLGTFERIREFIRKPYVIGEYMYANAIEVDKYPLFKEKGMLAFSTYSEFSSVTDDNKVEAGRDIFMLSCSRCHTVTGINSVVTKFTNMTKGKPVTKDLIKGYIPSMHKVWYYMPEFPGNDAELDALAEYIIEMNKTPEYLEGAQGGVNVAPANSIRYNEIEKLTDKGEK
jgi:hypothetical protein